jgi:p-cumate 2,3-dioxygenase subunit beta
MEMTRIEVEDFLYYEASLLDEWKLIEWAGLFTEDAHYLVPPTDKLDADFREELFIISDNHQRIVQRAERLLKKEAHVEYPHSRTRHLISNGRIRGIEDEIADVTSNFVTYRSKREKLDPFVGRIDYKLTKVNGEIKIKEKRVLMDLDALRPQGKVSIVL